MEAFLKENYGFIPEIITKLDKGLGSEIYYIKIEKKEYILKSPIENGMNHPFDEVKVCNFLNSCGLETTKFVPTINGEFFCEYKEKQYQLQTYVRGTIKEYNELSSEELNASAKVLARIHLLLQDYPRLTEGIGPNFFKYMTKEKALSSLSKSKQFFHNEQIIKAIEYQEKVLESSHYLNEDYADVTYGNTHGDYNVSQLIFQDNKIIPIDFTSCCYHPIIWEIVRNYFFGSKDYNQEEFLDYIGCYLSLNRLTKNDICLMLRLYYHQIAVCDYFRQYIGNQDIGYLKQAMISNKVLHFLDENMIELERKLHQL